MPPFPPAATDMTSTTLEEPTPYFRRCAICGQESRVCSTTFGKRDLDFRWILGAMPLVLSFVAECPHCGYCAADISRALLGAQATVASDDYQQLRRDTSRPVEATRFLCAAIVAERGGQFAVGG